LNLEFYVEFDSALHMGFEWIFVENLATNSFHYSS